MSNTKQSKPKLSEIAKNLNVPSQELIDFLQEKMEFPKKLYQVFFLKR